MAAELVVKQATGRTLTFDDYKALDAATRDALYVGGGSADSNDWLVPLLVNILVNKVQDNQNDEIVTLTKSDLTVTLTETKPPKPCQILQIGPARRPGLTTMIVATAPPHQQVELTGPWTLSIEVTQGQLSASADVHVVDVNTATADSAKP